MAQDDDNVRTICDDLTELLQWHNECVPVWQSIDRESEIEPLELSEISALHAR